MKEIISFQDFAGIDFGEGEIQYHQGYALYVVWRSGIRLIVTGTVYRSYLMIYKKDTLLHTFHCHSKAEFLSYVRNEVRDINAGKFHNKKSLKEQGWTRYRLAKESGVPESTLTNIFYRGTTPTVATLEDICKTLNITLSQFFAENDMVEMTDELKEFYDAWIALSPDKRKNILETMKMMK